MKVSKPTYSATTIDEDRQTHQFGSQKNMLLHKLSAVGLASLAFLHPAVRQFDINWEQDALRASRAAVDADMCANTYQNGVLFGLWAAGVAISFGRLLTYVMWGSRRGLKEAHTQTEDLVEGQQPSTEESKENMTEEQRRESKPTDESADNTMTKGDKAEVLGRGDSGVSRAPAAACGGDDGPAVKPDQPEKLEDHKETRPDTKISVYKLPAIKRHHFFVRQDGLKALRQSVKGDFTLQRVALDGIRNFIFLVATGSPSQLSDLEAKIRSDFRWLTPVREPSTKLTGGVAVQKPQTTSSLPDKVSRIPTKTTQHKSLTSGPRASLTHRTPSARPQK